MVESDDFRNLRIGLHRSSCEIPVMGFGTLIPDLIIAARLGRTPVWVLLAWATQRATAVLTTPKTEARPRRNFETSTLQLNAFDEINRIQTRRRFTEVVKTGSPRFIPQGRQS